jgi:hypothetical protein
VRQPVAVAAEGVTLALKRRLHRESTRSAGPTGRSAGEVAEPAETGIENAAQAELGWVAPRPRRRPSSSRLPPIPFGRKMMNRTSKTP